MPPISAELARRVRQRAKETCEYCRLPQSRYALTFAIEHIIARQHRGKTRFNNLALACPRCNRNKGPNIAGIDSETDELTALFHPRRQRWADHFHWRGPKLIGLTPEGRATVHLLGMNQPSAIKLRRELITEGVFPPSE